MTKNSIVQISSKGDKNISVRSHKEEFLRKIYRFRKIGNMTTISRHKGNSVITRGAAILKHWNFVIKGVPVESFVGSSTGTHC